MPDLDAYIDALPRTRLAEPRHWPDRFQEWRWPLTRPYHGFTPIERVRGWQVSKWLQAAGSLPYPRRCDLCHGTDRVGFHSSSYYHIARAPALCTRCHRAIHRRQRAPDQWRRIVDSFAVSGDEWFALEPPQDADLAGHLRSQQGWQAANILASLRLILPAAMSSTLPSNLMQHPRSARKE